MLRMDHIVKVDERERERERERETVDGRGKLWLMGYNCREMLI